MAAGWGILSDDPMFAAGFDYQLGRVAANAALGFTAFAVLAVFFAVCAAITNLRKRR